MNPHEGWRAEQRKAFLYRACAKADAGTVRAALFQRLAGAAMAQAAIWRAQLTAGGHPPPPPYAPDARAQLVARLVRWFGPRRMQLVLSAMMVRGMPVYTTSFAPDAGHALPTASNAVEFQHGSLGGGGTMRAAVFGVNDGLVSNASLILGVAGAGGDARLVLMSGVAGLAAGAFALAAGQYVSVRSRRELCEHRIALERDERTQHPEAKAQELALIYAAKGLPRKTAAKLAQRVVADPEHALNTFARAEPGLAPVEPGSPVGAAASSFLAFAAGAALPLVPFLFMSGTRALPAGVAATAVALFATGATLSLFTGRSAWYSGVRMLALGALAGGVTYGLGRLVGVALG